MSGSDRPPGGDEAAEPFPEPVEIPIEETLDLHFFRPGETASVVDAYLDAALEAGFREVRIIHGRGRGVQRHQVQRLLDGDPRVEAFADAPGDRGGWGATLARLVPPTDPAPDPGCPGPARG